MRVGIVILAEDRWWSGEPKWRHAEEFGFDHAWTYDHLSWGEPADRPWFGAVPTLAAAAAVTERIALGTFVLTPNFRHPVPLAREITALDDISDGRLLLGLGAGVGPGGQADRAAMGDDELTGGQLADRFAEFVAALDGLLAVDGFDFAGEYYRAVGARSAPGCVQRPRAPFAISATGPRSMGLAARYGDGWITLGKPGSDADSWWLSVRDQADAFDRALDDAGRDSAEVRRYLSVDAGPVYSLSSVDTFTEAARRAADLGFTDIVAHWPRALEPYAGREAVLERVADEVLTEVQKL